MMRRRKLVNQLAAALCMLVGVGSASQSVKAEDGYDLWLRYAQLEGAARQKVEALGPVIITSTAGVGPSPTLNIAAAELRMGLQKLAGVSGTVADTRGHIALACGSDATNDGRFAVVAARGHITISGPSETSCLYGAFALLRELSLGRDPAEINLSEQPAMRLRMLNHWDNPDGHVERGYAGRSIFDWWRLPDRLDRRMIDYARANASLGINGVVVNNVNASALFLTPRYLPKLKRLADAWRPYGIRLYISARFSAPHDVGGLSTSDPQVPAVKDWWRAKADEIYAAIPDFGGFLVKANAEGQPGPQDYGRTHAEGANMLAAALGSRGTVIWRAFVYQADDRTDRAKQAYDEFQRFDGAFAENVIVQVKNGPLDFQPREPFHPLFGAMPNTRLMLEVQVTREYLGQASGIVYLAPMWEEVLHADTGRGGTVSHIITPAGMAGVANTGSDRNWTGAHFDQANWYAFGRLAWNPSLSAETLAREWAMMTFNRNPRFIVQIVPTMLFSRERVVDYTGPLGLAHQMATGHHYGPGPWVCDLSRADWNPCTYAAADRTGIGFNRTESGSNAIAQYAAKVAANWDDPTRMDERYLLWFHHVAWDRQMRSGRPLWHALIAAYDRGVAGVETTAMQWARLAPYIDAERHADVTADLARQQKEAHWWRDASVAYWQSLNGLPLPRGVRAPDHPLDWYRRGAFPEAPGQ